MPSRPSHLALALLLVAPVALAGGSDSALKSQLVQVQRACVRAQGSAERIHLRALAVTEDERIHSLERLRSDLRTLDTDLQVLQAAVEILTASPPGAPED